MSTFIWQPPKGYVTRKGLAPFVGRSYSQIKRAEKAGLIIPDLYTTFGSLIVPLYSMKRIYLYKLAFAQQRPGRPRKKKSLPARFNANQRERGSALPSSTCS